MFSKFATVLCATAALTEPVNAVRLQKAIVRIRPENDRVGPNGIAKSHVKKGKVDDRSIDGWFALPTNQYHQILIGDWPVHPIDEAAHQFYERQQKNEKSRDAANACYMLRMTKGADLNDCDWESINQGPGAWLLNAAGF